MKPYKIIVILILLLTLLVGCDKKEENTMSSRGLRLIDNQYEGRVLINFFEKEKVGNANVKSGYCYNLNLTRKSVASFIYPDAENETFSTIETNQYGKKEFRFERVLGDNGIIIINFQDKNYTYNAQMMTSIMIPVEKIRQEKYNCIFQGQIRSTNNTYEQLKGQVCDSHSIYCGE